MDLITQETAVVAFNENVLEKLLKDIEADALNLVADVETATGRKQIISKAASIASAKVAIDNAGKNLNEERKKKTDAVNAERKKARDFLDNLKVRVRKPVTDYEEAEEAKKQAERDAAELEIAQEEAIAENDLFDRQKEVARKEAELQAIEDARLEKEREEQEEKDRIEREAKIAQDAKEKAEKEAKEKIEAAERNKIALEEKAKADAKQAEQDKKDALEKAERDQREAVEKARLAEQERLAKIERIKAEDTRIAKVKADRLAANKAHRQKLHREAKEDLVKNGISEEVAVKFITLLSKENIRHLRVIY